MSKPSQPQLAAYAFGGSTMTMLLPGEQTDGAFALVHIIKGPHSSTPMHSHQRETEISYVLDGRLGLATPAGITYLDAGESHMLPPGGAHRLFNDASSDMREFLVCAPALFDRFVATAGTPVAPFSAPGPMTAEAGRRISSHAPDFELQLYGQVPVEPASSSHGAATEILNVADARFEVLAETDQDSAVVLFRVTLPPAGVMRLSELADRHGLYLVQGQVDLCVEGSSWEAMSSETAGNVAAGCGYALRNTADGDAAVLMVSTVRTLHGLRALDEAPRRVS